jgi:hypothetical protein
LADVCPSRYCWVCVEMAAKFDELLDLIHPIG